MSSEFEIPVELLNIDNYCRCGTEVESLCTEYSESNIRLTRCHSCNQVADKYIEYEALIVLIDIILHRPAAYRHVLFNRHQFEQAKNSIRWMFLGIIFINSLLKFIILHEPTYSSWSSASILLLHLILSSVAEHGAFVVTIGIILVAPRQYRQLLSSYGYSKYVRRLYFAISFPEYFKLLALMLQVFDSEPELLMSFGILLLSIQFQSVQTFEMKTMLSPTVSPPSFRWLIFSLSMAAIVRLVVRRASYSTADTIQLGFFM